MRKLNIILLMSVFFMIYGCCNIDSKYQDLYNSVTEKVDGNIKYIVIIPEVGCGGCISYAEDFYKLNNNRKELFFIFTNVMSQKKIKQKVSINQRNTFIDKENTIMDYFPMDKRIYPCILEVNNGRVKNVYFQSPEEDGLSKI